jgi:hypothetical protein
MSSINRPLIPMQRLLSLVPVGFTDINIPPDAQPVIDMINLCVYQCAYY